MASLILEVLIIVLSLIVVISILVFASCRFYPRFALENFNRIFAIYLGLRKRKVNISHSIRICYYERGQKKHGEPTLLLVHGFASAKDYYFRLLNCLPPNLHTIVIDLPGHGESSMKDKDDLTLNSIPVLLKKFIDQLKLSKNNLNLLGVSMGGHIVGRYAASYPDDLNTLILVCPHGIQNKCVEEWEKKFFGPNQEEVFPRNADEFMALSRQLTHNEMKVPRWYAEGAAGIIQKKKHIFRQIGENLLSSGDQHSLEKLLEHISTPTLLMWGIYDKVIDVSCVDVIRYKLGKNLKKVELFDNCGHSIVLEKPKDAARNIMEFIREGSEN